MAALAALLFGLTIPASAPLLAYAGPNVLAGLLYVGAGIAVIAPSLRRTPHTPTPTRHAPLRLAVAVIAGGLIAPVLILLALQQSSASEVSLLLNLELAATVVIAVLFFRDHLPWRGWVGTVIIVLAGVILAGGALGSPMAVILVALACILWAIDSNISATLPFPAPRIVLVKGLVAGTANVLIGLLLGQPFPAMLALGAALIVGALGYGISLVSWIGAARRLGTARTTAIFALAPFIGALTAWIVDRSAPPTQLLAAAIAALGVALVITAGAHAHMHDHGDLRHAHPHLPDEDHRHDH